MTSPFQVNGFVWVDSSGYLLTPGGVRAIYEKPLFSFPYDHLYCEPTVCRRTTAAGDFALTEAEAAEVMAFIDAQLALPMIVDGVDADGRFLSQVPENAVVRAVHTPPPSRGTWRFDFAKAAVYPGDHWRQAVCVDAEGRYLGNVDEGEWAALADTPPPAQTFGEDFRWQNGQWVDVRPEADKLAAAKELKIAQAFNECDWRLENASVTVHFSEHSFAFGCDRETRENISGIVNAINAERSGLLPPGTVANPRPFAPKGQPLLAFSHEALAQVGAAIMAGKDAFMGAYFVHKEAIKALTSVEAVLAYDVTANWPASAPDPT